VWRSHDPEIDRVSRPFVDAPTPIHKQPVQVLVTARVGEPLQLEWSIAKTGGRGARAVVRSDHALAPSETRPATLEFLRGQLGRLGNTPYTLASVEAVIEGAPFIPSSLLNDLRRAAVTQLEAQQGRTPEAVVNDPADVLRVAMASSHADTRSEQPRPRLHLLVRTPEQLEAAIAIRPASITLDYLDLYGLRPAVERIEAAGITARVASPRVLKPDEQRIVSFLVGLECDIVARSAGLVQALLRFSESGESSKPMRPWIGDFSLNAANALTARAFLDLGLERLTPTHDLNAAQVADLARAIGAGNLEVIAYQHLPVFHTEHCVFCRFLSTGTSYEDCGRPCEKHRVALRDTSGHAHPVMADVGCRNTVFEARAQEASAHLETWRDAGIADYRLEFVHETAEEVTQIARAFASALDGRMDHANLRSQLKRIAPQGVTEGSLFVPENYLKVPSIE
jgi:putative protease